MAAPAGSRRRLPLHSHWPHRGGLPKCEWGYLPKWGCLLWGGSLRRRLAARAACSARGRSGLGWGPPNRPRRRSPPRRRSASVTNPRARVPGTAPRRPLWASSVAATATATAPAAAAQAAAAATQEAARRVEQAAAAPPTRRLRRRPAECCLRATADERLHQWGATDERLHQWVATDERLHQWGARGVPGAAAAGAAAAGSPAARGRPPAGVRAGPACARFARQGAR